MNLLGGAYRLTSVAGGVRFDLRNEGIARQVSWTAAGEPTAFLALDRNGNDRIDTGAELFGNFTPLRTGAIARHGFEALAELDDDANGVVDAADAAWRLLLLWTDVNHDGSSTADELAPIANGPVVALNTAYQVVGRRDEWGNLFRYMSRFERAGVATHDAPYYDVFFRIGE